MYQDISARSLLITQRSRPWAGACVRAARFLGAIGADVPEAVGFVDALVQQQIDVVEQELAALVVRDRARPAGRRARSAACARIHGLRSTPRPTSTPATPAVAQALDDLLGLDAVAAAEHRNRDALRDAGDQRPSPTRRCTTAPRCGRAR